LADPALLEEYFSALQSYYGGPERFPRESFDAVLKQLTKVKGEVPRLAQRLWETSHPGTGGSVQTSTRTYRRNLNDSAWRDYLDAWKKRLAQQAAPIQSLPTPEARAKRIGEILDRVDGKIRDFEAGSATTKLTKKERVIREGEFYSALAQD